MPCLAVSVTLNLAEDLRQSMQGEIKLQQIFQEKLENLIEHAKAVQDLRKVGEVRSCTCVSEIASKVFYVLNRNTQDLSISDMNRNLLTHAMRTQRHVLNDHADSKPQWEKKVRAGSGPYPGPTPPPGSRYGGKKK